MTEISKEIFDKETGLCRAMCREKGGCNWGTCSDCGVTLLLHKLYHGKVIEDKEEVRKLKDSLHE